MKAYNSSSENREEELDQLINKAVELIIAMTKRELLKWMPLTSFDIKEHPDEYDAFNEFAKELLLNGTFIAEKSSYVASFAGYYYFCLCLKNIESKQTITCLFIIQEGNKTKSLFTVDTNATDRLYNILKFTIGSDRKDVTDSLDSVKSVLDSLNSSQSG